MKQQIEVKITMEVDADLDKKDIINFLKKLDVGEKPTKQERIQFSNFLRIIVKEEAQIYGNKEEIEVGDEVIITDLKFSRIYDGVMFEKMGFKDHKVNDPIVNTRKGTVFSIDTTDKGVTVYGINLGDSRDSQILMEKGGICLT